MLSESPNRQLKAGDEPSPTSVKPAQIQLSDPQTGAKFWVDLPLDRELDAPQRAALRLVRDDRPRRR